MRIDIITTHPKMFSGALDHSILKRSQDKKIVKIEYHDLRNFSSKKADLLTIINTEEEQEWL